MNRVDCILVKPINPLDAIANSDFPWLNSGGFAPGRRRVFQIPMAWLLKSAHICISGDISRSRSDTISRIPYRYSFHPSHEVDSPCAYYLHTGSSIEIYFF